MLKSFGNNGKSTTRLVHLFKMRQIIMALPPESVVDFILDYNDPRELVHSFSEEDLYFLLHTIGIEETSSIIALASDSQWEYFLDLEIWDKDSLNFFSATNLLVLMMTADPERLAMWCFYEKIQFTEIYLFRNLVVKVIENDECADDVGDNFFTNDGVFYLRPVDYCTTSENEQEFLKKRNQLLRDLLFFFAKIDHLRYQGLIMEVIGVIPAELEEELLRLKNVRLAEKGFLPFYEAVGIYQPLNAKDIKKMVGKKIKEGSVDYSLYPLACISPGILDGNNLFIKLLRNVKNDSILQQLQVEFTSLCNLVLSADNKKTNNYEEIKNVVSKVSGFLNIGIELILEDLSENSVLNGNDIVINWRLNDIFRVGYSQALNLKSKASKWYKKSWFNTQSLKLHFWGEHWFGVIGGLLLDRPKFFNKSGNISNYCEFASIYEISKIEEVLNQIIDIDNMLARLEIDFSSYDFGIFTNVKNLLFTMWFLSKAGLAEGKVYFQPISFEVFKPLYMELWEKRKGQMRVKESEKADFLRWIVNKMGIDSYMLSPRLSLFFEELFQTLEEELSEVPFVELDPRYITLFIIDI